MMAIQIGTRCAVYTVASPRAIPSRTGREGGDMARIEARPQAEATTSELVKQAVAETRELIEIEVALAKEEVRDEARRVKGAAFAIGAAVAAALIGISLLLVSLALSMTDRPIAAAVIGVVLVACAIALAIVGNGLVPRGRLPRTRRRIMSDVRVLKERVA
jgi:hypothetical protein